MREYHHRQWGALVLLIVGLTVLLLISILFFVEAHPVVIVVLCILVVCLILFATLTVEVTRYRRPIEIRPRSHSKEVSARFHPEREDGTQCVVFWMGEFTRCLEVGYIMFPAWMPLSSRWRMAALIALEPISRQNCAKRFAEPAEGLADFHRKVREWSSILHAGALAGFHGTVRGERRLRGLLVHVVEGDPR